MSSQTPISPAMYSKLTEREWIGRNVMTLADITTAGGIVYPNGSLAKVTRKFGGLHIEGEKCLCCGVKLLIRQISPSKLSLVDDAPLLPQEGGEA
ncbi:hypothetical protein GGQ73_001839 [Rhizobium skierniewicense]|uniref:Uncharacterized protein n=1 Tax=Rhizobium skierniewicense TaxID=984260 RepID=A0A7W6G1Z2_9HYPH|nr:hypothetical protein [Rhizobium skierniewicense]MBB3945904.1 hypothetical protein [Rhizobium skierniewicense]